MEKKNQLNTHDENTPVRHDWQGIGTHIQSSRGEQLRFPFDWKNQ